MFFSSRLFFSTFAVATVVLAQDPPGPQPPSRDPCTGAEISRRVYPSHGLASSLVIDADTWLHWPVAVDEAGQCFGARINFVAGKLSEQGSGNEFPTASLYGCLMGDGRCPAQTCFSDRSTEVTVGPQYRESQFFTSPSYKTSPWSLAQCDDPLANMTTAGLFFGGGDYDQVELAVTWISYPCSLGQAPSNKADTCTSNLVDLSGGGGTEGFAPLQYDPATADEWTQLLLPIQGVTQTCVRVQPKWESGTPIVGNNLEDLVTLKVCGLWSSCAVGPSPTSFACPGGETTIVVGPNLPVNNPVEVHRPLYGPHAVLAVSMSSKSVSGANITLGIALGECERSEPCPDVDPPAPSPTAGPSPDPTASPGASPTGSPTGNPSHYPTPSPASGSSSDGSSSSSSGNGDGDGNGDKNSKKKSNKGAVAAGVIIPLLLIGAGGAAFVFYRRKQAAAAGLSGARDSGYAPMLDGGEAGL